MNKLWKSALVSLIGLSLAPNAVASLDNDTPNAEREQATILDYSLIAARNASILLERKEGLVILDVRSSAKYAKSHIRGAAHIALDDPNFNKKLKRLDKNVLILIYDDLDPPVAETKAGLLEAGFTKAIYLRDGFTAWQRLDLPIETDGMDRNFDTSAKPVASDQ